MLFAKFLYQWVWYILHVYVDFRTWQLVSVLKLSANNKNYVWVCFVYVQNPKWLSGLLLERDFFLNKLWHLLLLIIV